MKNIIIKSIDISDFKGISNRKVEFHHGRNTIKGRNGAGKSTLAEAIIFTLTGAGLFAEKVLNEPLTKEGVIKENFKTQLTLTIEVNGESNIIKRTYVNEKNKSNTLTNMSINDKPYSKRRDFNEAIEELIGLKEKEFQMFANPKHLNSLKNKESREFIISLVESESDITTINNYLETIQVLTEPIKQYTDRVKQNITKDISLEEQLKMKEQEVKTSNEKLSNLDITLTSKVETLGKISVLADDEKDVEALETEKELLKARIANVHEQNSKVLEFERSKNQLVNSIRNCKIIINKNENDILDKQNAIKGNMKDIEELAIKFDNFNLKPITDTCSICGSVTDKTKELGEAAKQKSLDDIEAVVAERQKANKIHKSAIKNAKENLKMNKDSLEQMEVRLAQLSFENVTLDVTELQERLEKINETLANDGSITIIKQEITELQKDLTLAKSANDDLELEKYTLEQIFKFKAEAIEETINKELDGTTIKLFEIKKNGNVKDIFTIAKDGIDFDRLNTAAQINAGIALLNFAQKAKGINLPIFVDNAESVNKLTATESQTIELYVSETNLEVK